jgi:predicted secreted protein
MKIYGALLALSAFQAAEAFSPGRVSGEVRSTELFSTPPFPLGLGGRPPVNGGGQTLTATPQQQQQFAAPPRMAATQPPLEQVPPQKFMPQPEKVLSPIPIALKNASPTWTSAPAPENQQIALKPADRIWDEATPVVIQGSSLRTCSFPEPIERVEVLLKSEGRPINANIELWQGPDNTPQKVKVYVEDGLIRPFRAILETPGGSNAIAVLNTANMEFPLAACLAPGELSRETGGSPAARLASVSNPKIVQGGAVMTTPFAPEVSSVQVMLQTDGRPCNARIELLQGPNNIKQVMEVYVEDGMTRPFFAVIETPGDGNVVRIVNTSTLEYPLVANVQAYLIDRNQYQISPDGMQWSD